MADVILVLNAGSSSIKFSAFDAGSAALHAAAARPGRRALHDAAFRRQGRARRRDRIQGLGQRHRTRPRRRDRSPGRVPARASARDHRLVAVGHRVVHGGVAFTQAVRVDARGDRRAGDAEPARAAAPAAQPQADRDRREAAPGPAAGGLLRHRVPSHAAGGGAGLRAARRRSPSAACGATASTACRTSTSPACWRSSTPRPLRAAPSWRTSATAAACARWSAAAAWPARWASRPWTGCRWARAAAASTPASSCT